MVALNLTEVASPSETVEVIESDPLHTLWFDVEIGEGHQRGVVTKDGVLEHLDHLIVGNGGMHQLVAETANHLNERRRVGCDTIVRKVDHVAHELRDLLVRVLIRTSQLKRLPFQLVNILQFKYDGTA